MNHRTLMLVISCLLFSSSCFAGPLPPESDPVYSSKRPSRDGIGKVYMGREISFVMGHRGVGWLERPERQREERTDLVIDGMELPPDAVVADLGAGSGYFTFRISPRVPEGRVLAVDIQPEMLEVIERRKLQGAYANVEAVQATETQPNLPANTVDAVLLVDAYHEFSHPREVMDAVVESLRPGGRVYLVEYRGEDPSIPIYPLHKMTEAQARLEMEAVGLEFVENRKMLPSQHFMIFSKPDAVSRQLSDEAATEELLKPGQTEPETILLDAVTFADWTLLEWPGLGLEPDIFVEETLADFLAGRDPVLDKTRELAQSGIARRADPEPSTQGGTP